MEERLRSLKKIRNSCRHDLENGGDSGGRRKKRTVNKRVLLHSVDDLDDLENGKKEQREAQGAQGLNKDYCREGISPLSRLIRGFRGKYH